MEIDGERGDITLVGRVKGGLDPRRWHLNWEDAEGERTNTQHPSRGISNCNGPVVRTHLGFAKNQTVFSLESEGGCVRRKWKRLMGVMMSTWLGFWKGQAAGLSGLVLKDCGPSGLRAVLTQTACHLQQQHAHPPHWNDVPRGLRSCLPLSIPITQGLHLHSQGEALIVSLHAQWFESRRYMRDCSSVSQECQPLTTPMTEKVRLWSDFIYTVTSWQNLRSLLVDEHSTIFYLWNWRKKGFLFLSKRKMLTQDLNSVLFVCELFSQCLDYTVLHWFQDIHFPLILPSKLIMHVAISGASQVLTQLLGPVHAHLVRAGHTCQLSPWALLILHVVSIISI